MSKNNKICILTSAHSAFDIRIFQKESKSLAKAGYKVTMIAQNNKNETVDGVRIISLPKAKNRIHRMISLTWKAFWLALKEKAEIYHFHDPELIPIGILLKLRGKKIIYDVHEDYSLAIKSRYWIPLSVRKLVAVLFKSIENFSAMYFSGVVPATPAIAKRFRSLNRNTVIVQNFPIIDEFSLKKDGVSWDDRTNAVAYIGGIDLLRGIKEMVEAIRLTQEVIEAKLILAGNFSPESLKEDIKNMEGWKNVGYRGFLCTEEVVNIMEQVKAGLVLFYPEPNHIQAQPNKLFEYMSAGIPVIASDFPLWRQIVEEAGCGLLVDPLDPKAISEAIIYILEHPKEAEAVGNRGRKAIEEQYNWYKEEKKLLCLYERLLE